MKEFIIFVCTDSTEIFFSKRRSAGLNYNLPSIFTYSYCAGVSNRHCLLTFFIVLCFVGRYLCPFLFCNHLDGEERAGCFALFAFLVSRDCCVSLPRGDMGLSAVYDCGIS